MRVISEKDLLRARDLAQQKVNRLAEELENAKTELQSYESGLLLFDTMGRNGHRLQPDSRVPREPASGAKLQKPGRRRPDDREMANVSRKAIFAQTDEFVPMQVTDHLQKHHPEIAARMPTGYISTLLWRLTKAGLVRIVRKGGPGKPNAYAIVSKK